MSNVDRGGRMLTQVIPSPLDAIKRDIKQALGILEQTGVCAVMPMNDVPLWVAKQRSHGDYCSPLALILSRQDPSRCVLIAHTLVDALILPWGIARVEVAHQGYINFFLTPEAYAHRLRALTPQAAGPLMEAPWCLAASMLPAFRVVYQRTHAILVQWSAWGVPDDVLWEASILTDEDVALLMALEGFIHERQRAEQTPSQAVNVHVLQHFASILQRYYNRVTLVGPCRHVRCARWCLIKAVYDHVFMNIAGCSTR